MGIFDPKGEPTANRFLRQFIRRHEGVREQLYQDHLGYWTIGIGHLVDRRKGQWCDDELARRLAQNGFRLSPRMVQAYLDDDIERAQSSARRLYAPIWAQLDAVRQAALFAMAFNLGHAGLAGFKNMRAAIVAQDWLQAQADALDSRWARQVPHRAHETAAMLASGQPPDGWQLDRTS